MGLRAVSRDWPLRLINLTRPKLRMPSSTVLHRCILGIRLNWVILMGDRLHQLRSRRCNRDRCRIRLAWWLICRYLVSMGSSGCLGRLRQTAWDQTQWIGVARIMVGSPFIERRKRFLRRDLCLPGGITEKCMGTRHRQPLGYTQRSPFHCMQFRSIRRMRLGS